MTGLILVECPYCDHKFKARAFFPQWNAGFRTMELNCPACDGQMTVVDDHEYDKETGEIK